MQLSPAAQEVLHLYERYRSQSPDPLNMLFVVSMEERGPAVLDPLMELVRKRRLPERLVKDVCVQIDLRFGTHLFVEVLLREDTADSYVREAITGFGGMEYQLDVLKQVAQDEQMSDFARQRARYVLDNVWVAISPDAVEVMKLYWRCHAQGGGGSEAFTSEIGERGVSAAPGVLESARTGRLGEGEACAALRAIDVRHGTHVLGEALLKPETPASCVRAALVEALVVSPGNGGIDKEIEFLREVVGDEGRPKEERRRAEEIVRHIERGTVPAL
jgi:hypothetical protein